MALGLGIWGTASAVRQDRLGWLVVYVLVTTLAVVALAILVRGLARRRANLS